MFKLIQKSEKKQDSVFNVDSYTIIDNGETIRFWDSRFKEFKRISMKHTIIKDLNKKGVDEQ